MTELEEGEVPIDGGLVREEQSEGNDGVGETERE